jgi:hypothetical protein
MERIAMAGGSNKEPQNFEGDPSIFDIQDSIFDSTELVARWPPGFWSGCNRR